MVPDPPRAPPGRPGAVCRLLLGPLALGYAGVVSLRNRLYDWGLVRVRRLPVPVLCVGNLVAGGTGKTPLVAWLVRGLLGRGRRPGILARGYGGPARPGEALNDEGLVLRHQLGEAVPQRQHADRYRAGRELLALHPDVDVLVLDDGFQHRRLARDLDLVLLDAADPFGGGHVLPAGRLREPPGRALARAGAVLLTRAERVPAAALKARVGEIAGRTPAPVAVARTRAVSVQTPEGPAGPEILIGTPLHLCSGLGDPRAFEDFVRGLGARVLGHERLADHAAPRPGALAALAERALAAGARALLLTRKDAVKQAALPPGTWVLDVETEIVAGEAALWTAIERAVGGVRAP